MKPNYQVDTKSNLPNQFIKGKGFLAQDVRVAAQTGNLEKMAP